LKNDRGETQNLAQDNPAKLQELVNVYNQYTQQNGVKEYFLK
jgi:arylsulfatase